MPEGFDKVFVIPGRDPETAVTSVNLLKAARKINKNADYNIFKSLDNVNLNCVLGTKTNGVYKSFLEDYDKKDKNK